MEAIQTDTRNRARATSHHENRQSAQSKLFANVRHLEHL